MACNGAISCWVPCYFSFQLDLDGKPLATGIFLADYLIRNYSMWFTNLSAPLVAEGYLDFGPGGVVAVRGRAWPGSWFY